MIEHAKKCLFRQSGTGISKQKALGLFIAVFGGLPMIAPHFANMVPRNIYDGILGVAALLVIVARQVQKDL